MYPTYSFLFPSTLFPFLSLPSLSSPTLPSFSLPSLLPPLPSPSMLQERTSLGRIADLESQLSRANLSVSQMRKTKEDVSQTGVCYA